MSYTQRLDLRVSQNLVMTPQLQQAIKLLQFSALELEAHLATEIEHNPLLKSDAPSESGETADLPTDFAPADDLRGTDAGFASLFDGSNGLSWQGGNGAAIPDAENDPVARIKCRDTLLEAVQQGIRLSFASPELRRIAGELTERLDERGYITDSDTVLAKEIDCEPEDIAHVMDKLRGFEPTGVFARSLADCLGLQLAERDRLDPAMQALLDHLDLAVGAKFDRLKKICGVDEEDLRDMLGELRLLDPAPAGQWELEQDSNPGTRLPDVLMKQKPDGTWFLELNPETMPRLLIDMEYKTDLESMELDGSAKSYVSEKMAHANWLKKALDQRAKTILKVSSEIVRRQDLFFVNGIRDLKPMTLKDVAETIGMHESTISRVTTQKYIATPRGLFELKYFFTQGISAPGGQSSVSAESVKALIRDLINQEEGEKPFSDDLLVKLLRAQGADLARRTVAKYREAMNIPSSTKRKRAYKAGLLTPGQI
ncbi:MAG: RNA polymerase factor sigma-54 [Alphaproteobacteria bacterium]